jgi:hypothetical protein
MYIIHYATYKNQRITIFQAKQVVRTMYVDCLGQLGHLGIWFSCCTGFSRCLAQDVNFDEIFTHKCELMFGWESICLWKTIERVCFVNRTI